MIAGMAIAGSLAASFAATAWQLQLALGLCFGFAGAALGNVPHSALLARWYRNRLSMVVAVVYASIGIGIVGLSLLIMLAAVARFGRR